MADLAPGDIVWAKPDVTVGREQAGRRPVLVVSGSRYLDVADTLAIVVPLTRRRRDWPNHVPVAGLAQPSWAMAEQVRTISRDRIAGVVARTDEHTLHRVRDWLALFLDL